MSTGAMFVYSVVVLLVLLMWVSMFAPDIRESPDIGELESVPPQVRQLRSCSPLERRAVATSLARANDAHTVAELKLMASGEGYWRRSEAGDRCIGVECLADTRDSTVLAWLRQRKNAPEFLDSALQAALTASIAILEESTTRYVRVPAKLNPAITNDLSDTNYVLPTISDLMRLRLSGDISWEEAYVSVSAAAVDASGHRIKVIRHCKELLDPKRSYTSAKEYVGSDGWRHLRDIWGLELLEAEYQSLSGQEFDLDRLSQTVGSKTDFMILPGRVAWALVEDDAVRARFHYEAAGSVAAVVSHPGWRALVGDDALLEQYAHEVFKRVKLGGGHDAMDFLLPPPFAHSMLGPWVLGSVDIDRSVKTARSSAQIEMVNFGEWLPLDPVVLAVRPDLLKSV